VGRPSVDVDAELYSGPETVSELARSPATRAVRRSLWAALNGTPLVEPPLYVLHIMKTGGTSLVDGLRPGLAPPVPDGDLSGRLVSVPRYVLENVPLVTGHLGYEARKLLPPRFVTCVVLRDPVERTLSHYAHLQRNPEVIAECPDFSLEQFVRSPRWRSLCDNYQARQLVHEVRLERAWVDFSPEEEFRSLGPPFPPEHSLPLQSLFDCSPLSVPADELLDRACERLDTIEFVSVTDRLDELFARVARSWGVDNPPPLPRLQVGPGRPHAEDVPGRLLDAIREATAVDSALYERARER